MVGPAVTNGALQSSPFVRRFASTLVSELDGPVIDVGCGSGRHAFLLASLGAEVICVDKELGMFDKCCTEIEARDTNLWRLAKVSMDLLTEPWPFGPSTVGAIVNVHCHVPQIFRDFRISLGGGGYLLIETAGGQGANYLQLPKAGELEAAFKDDFDMLYYHERTVGPADYRSVAVKLLARKHGTITRK